MLPNEDHLYMNAVQERLERLYHIDGRADKSHPLHAHYTGLAAKYSGLGSHNRQSSGEAESTQ